MGYQFTPEKAREASLKGQQVRAQRRLERQLKAQQEEQALRHEAHSEPLEMKDAPVSLFWESQLPRVKEHLMAIDAKLTKAIQKDSKGALIRALADSRTKLAEQYRIMAGIPLPGSHRPVAPRPGKDRPPAGPLD